LQALIEASENDKFTHVIVRPGRLVGGPWTNFDLAGLFKIENRGGEGVKIEVGDELVGDASRDRVAQVCFAALASPVCSDVDFAVVDDDEGKMDEDEMGAAFGRMVGLEV
jgi:hypothetical protein